jgi:hypothetical protein
LVIGHGQHLVVVVLLSEAEVHGHAHGHTHVHRVGTEAHTVTLQLALLASEGSAETAESSNIQTSR